jgi:integrase
LWEAKYTITESTGRSRRVSIYGKSKKEASDKLNAALAAKARGAPVPHGRDTLAAFLTDWLEGARRTRNIQPSTWQRYEALIRLHVIPQLGRTRLADLRAHTLRAHYTRLQEGGLGASTTHHVHRALRRALSDAVLENRILINPASRLGWKRPRAPEMRTLTLDQARQLLEHADDWDRCLFFLAVATGMRSGELLGLKWSDVDLTPPLPFLRVVRTLLDVRAGLPVYGVPKTMRSRRQIELSGALATALRGQQARLKEAHIHVANVWRLDEEGNDLDLVFPTRLGSPRRRANVTRDFRIAQSKFLRRPIRFHDLRHTAATLLLGKMDPKTTSEMLGHSDVSITLSTYSHATPARHREAAEAMAQLLTG